MGAMKPATRTSPNDPQHREGDCLDVMQGDDYAAIVTVTDEYGVPADLTGYTAQAQIRRQYADYEPDVAVEITCAVVLPNEVHLSIPAAQTAALRSGWVWDLQLVSAAGVVTTVLWGSLLVHYEVTRTA